jgi:peptidoglycan biosynthesis protein MviN/MurJ (putative lipid II flippase)
VTVDETSVLRKAARDSVTVAGWTLVSRVTGLLRVIIAGAVLGPTFFGNLFQAVYVLPGLVYSAVAGPVLAMVLVPTIIAAAAGGGLPQARRVAAGVSGVVLAVAAAVALLLAAVSPLVAQVLTLGFPAGGDAARGRELAILLGLFVAPQVVFHTTAALGVAAQQARGRFALAAAAPAIENVGLIATVASAGAIWGRGLEIGGVPTEMVVWLGIGCTGSVAVHALVQLIGTARCGMLVRPTLRGRRIDAVRRTNTRLLRSLGVAAWPSASMFVLLAAASTVPGGVIVVQMAYAVYHTASYLTGRAVSMAALPKLADAAEQGDLEAYALRWRQCLTYGVVASVPVLVLLPVLAEPVARHLAQGELEDVRVIAVLAGALAVVGVAQLALGQVPCDRLGQYGQQALFARHEDRWPRRASEIALLVVLVTAGIALASSSGDDLIVALVLAIPLSELAATLVVLGAVRSAVRPSRLFDGRQMTVTALAALALLPFALGAAWLHTTFDLNGVKSLGVLVVACLGAVLLYGVILRSTIVWKSGANA